MNLLKTSAKRYYALFLAVCFFSTQLTPGALAEADASSSSPLKLPQDLQSIKLPSEWGKAEDFFNGKSGKQVIIIQDAHAVTDAQKNIQRLIGFFQKEFSVRLVGVEGVSSELDPQIFKSFPDKKLLEKTFEEYFQRGELTGSTAAAILNETPSRYHGIEDWELYEKGLALFLDAEKNNAEVLERVKLLKADLQARKEKVYPAQLLEIDRVMEGFYSNGSNLLEAVNKLAEFKAPEKNSELAALLEQSRVKEGDGKEAESEVKRMASAVQGQLKTPEDVSAFNAKDQAFKTSQVSAQEFALFLKEKAAENGVKLNISARVEFLIANQKKMRDIEGTRFFKDFEAYAASVKGLFLTDEKLKALDRENRRLELFEKMSKLQLTNEEWREVRKFPSEAEMEKVFKRQADFYVNAEARDEVFFKKILQLMSEEKTSASMMVAGGFHSDGMRQLLKDAEISYLLVRPRIEALPENNVYLEHMNGNVSWKKYFEVEDGKVNVYQAFVRTVRDKLLSVSPENPGKLLKSWRDQIIRDLAKIRKVSFSGRYTKFMDENAKSENELLDEKLLKVDQFIDALRRLETQGKLNGQNALGALRPSNILDPATAGVIAPFDFTLALAGTRSEVRAFNLNSQDTAALQITDLANLSIEIKVPGSDESWFFSGSSSGQIKVYHKDKEEDAAFPVDVPLKIMTKSGELYIFFTGNILAITNKNQLTAVSVNIISGAARGISNNKSPAVPAPAPAPIAPAADPAVNTAPMPSGGLRIYEILNMEAMELELQSPETGHTWTIKAQGSVLAVTYNDGTASPKKMLVLPSAITTFNGIEIYHDGSKLLLKNQTTGMLVIKKTKSLTAPTAAAAPLVQQEPQNLNPAVSADGEFESFKITDYTITPKIQDGDIYFLVEQGETKLLNGPFKISEKNTFKFGRQPQPKSDVYLPLSGVSREHALVTVDFINGAYIITIKDLGSTNGIRVGGNKIFDPVILPKISGTPTGLPARQAPARVIPAAAAVGSSVLPLAALDVFLKSGLMVSSHIYMEYDLKRKRVLPISYSMRNLDVQAVAGDPKIAKAFNDFNEFENINYAVLQLMSKPDLTLADWKELRLLLSNMVEAYQDLYGRAVGISPITFELVAEVSPILQRILKEVEDDMMKIPAATRPVKATDLLPKSITDLIRKIDPALTGAIIGMPPGSPYPVSKLEEIGFHELINIVHQKGIRNLLYLILSFNVKKRKLAVNQQSPEDADLLEMEYIDARLNPDKEIPLPMQHVTMAFAKGQRVHEHRKLFSPGSANIYADDQQAGIRMKLGVHSARVQYAYQPTQEKGRIVVNYRDSYPNDPRSLTRVGILKDVLEALGFKVVVNDIQLDAYYDKDSAKTHNMSEMPDKLTAVIQVLSMLKDWDLKFGGSDRAEIAARITARLIEDGYIGPLGGDWRSNPVLLSPKLPLSVQDEMQINAEAAGIDIGEKPFGQRDLDYLNEELLRLLARGAILINSRGVPQAVDAYKKSAAQSPIETLLKMMGPDDKPVMDSMRAVAAIATAAKYFGQSQIIGDVRGYQVVKMVLPLEGDRVTFYLLKDPETGMFRLGYAVLGDFLHEGERVDIFRRKQINGNLLSVKDLEEILAPQNVASGQALLDWLDTLGIRAKHAKNNIFKILAEEPKFLDEAIPDFDMDTLKYGAVRSTISPTSIGGMPINQGKAIGRAIINREDMSPALFRGGIFIARAAEVTDDLKMDEAEGLVFFEGGPSSHGSIQAQEKKKPAIVLNGGAELTPNGIQFQTVRGQGKRKKILMPAAADKSAAEMTYLGGFGEGEEEAVQETATVQNGDLVYQDADSGMFYLLSKADDDAASGSADLFRAWKQSSDKDPEKLKAILAGIKNENLFKAVIDMLVSSNFLDAEKLQEILASFLTDPAKKEIIMVFFERRLRSAQGKFIKAYNELLVISKNASPDMLAVYLIMERLRVNREALQAFMQIFETEGTQHPIRQDLETRWRMVVRVSKDMQAAYRELTLERVRKILSEGAVAAVRAKLETSKGPEISMAEASSLLSRASRLRENIELGDFTEQQLKEGPLSVLLDLEKKLTAFRESQSEAAVGNRRVIGKDELMNMSARSIAGGKTDNSGAMRRALQNLPMAFPNLNFKVRNPDGFAVLASNYFKWKDRKQSDPELKKEIAKAYFELVNKQRLSLLAFLETDTETAPDFIGYLKSVLEVEPEDVNDAMVRMWRMTFTRFMAQTPEIASLSLRNRLQVFTSVAARSSGLNEDRKDKSMAGQKETKLNVSGVDNIVQAVVDVWESGAEGVLVDEMTNPEAAILVFSTDTVTKEQNIRLTAGHGLTKGLVDSDGVPDPDVMVIKRVSGSEFKVISNHIGDKSRGVVLDLERGGTKTVGISEIFPQAPGKARQATLSAEQIQTVARVAQYLSQSVGFPLDIEGGFQGNELLIFQIRPITTVSEAVDQAKTILRRSELRAESGRTQVMNDLKAEVSNLGIEKEAFGGWENTASREWLSALQMRGLAERSRYPEWFLSQVLIFADYSEELDGIQTARARVLNLMMGLANEWAWLELEAPEKYQRAAELIREAVSVDTDRINETDLGFLLDVVSWLKGHTKINEESVALGAANNEDSNIGHTDTVNNAVELQNGNIVTVSDDRAVRIWNAETGALVRTLLGHQESITNIKELKNGNIITVSDDGTARIWNTETGELVRTLLGHQGRISNVTELRNGNIITASADGTARIWNPETGELVRVLEGHDAGILGVTELKNGNIVTVSEDQTVRIWDGESGDVVHMFFDHEGPVTKVVELRTGYIVTVSDDSTARIWNPETGELVHTLEGHTGAVQTVTELRTGNIVTGSGDRTARIWNPETGELVRTLPQYWGGSANILELRDGNIVMVSLDNAARILNPETGELVFTFEGHQGPIMNIAELRGGKIVTVSLDRTALIRTLRQTASARSELRNQTAEVLAGIAAEIENPVSTSVTAQQMGLVIAEYRLEDLRVALKETLKARAANRAGNETAISDEVFNELTAAALNILGTPVNGQVSGLTGTVGFIFNEKETPSNSFVRDFMKILAQSNVKTVVISGKGTAANEIAKGVREEGRTPYPIKNPNQRMTLDTDGPVPALALNPSSSTSSDTFMRFVVNNEGVNDTLAEDFAGFLGAWFAVRSAELLSADPARFKDRKLLRAELLKNLFAAGIDAGAILSDDNGEFQIKTALAKVFLQALSQQKVQQSA